MEGLKQNSELSNSVKKIAAWLECSRMRKLRAKEASGDPGALWRGCHSGGLVLWQQPECEDDK